MFFSVIVISLPFSLPTRSSALFSLASLTFWFISLSISFLDFLNSLFFSGSLQFSIWRLYILLFYWHPCKVWIWYLVVIYFLLVSNMSFCCAFDYVLELFPFVLVLYCYVCATLSFLFNLLSISFLVLFILCKLSSVEPLLCWASFDDKFLPMSVLFWQRQVCGTTMFLSLSISVHRSGLACSFDSR